MSLAVLLTCYNRKAKTLDCMSKLLPQLERSGMEYAIYICDDKSTDGTYESLKEMLPDQIVIQSTGNLFWCKGMHLVMKMAVEKSYDYYLMINDDVIFEDNVLETMFSSYYKAGGHCGIVGATKASASENYTYGGRNKNEEFIFPEKEIKECIWANWNCFLIDKEVVEKVGIIDGKYQHGWGDYDYSYRMCRAGYKIFVANKCIGRCDLNDFRGSFRDRTVKRIIRIKKLFAPKGVPFYSYMRYHIKIGGKTKIIVYLWWYLSMIAYIFLGRDLR